ncbi:hypothetical protein DSCO28_65100 [Desulfosarcina ovata subsp. sediminis]|uniref:Uncharacterized protein n=1 Tax=Desulfosarcina ovata subsp. sediminis TaxID=885957 RepID=A0A5K8A0N5_9BACT|nr:hypothetical protein DSCO28_65100 [Desulfosarcina ovata subsp. sediminis]
MVSTITKACTFELLDRVDTPEPVERAAQRVRLICGSCMRASAPTCPTVCSVVWLPAVVCDPAATMHTAYRVPEPDGKVTGTRHSTDM